jgi:2'-5' RNA ligase
MKTIRCFLAVKLNIEAVRSLSEAQVQLKNLCKEARIDVRWVPPPNMHITMRFLGNITEPMAYAIEDMLQPIIAQTEIFDLETAGLGAFPGIGRPRVIWAGSRNGTAELTDLHAKVSKRLVATGFQLDDKPFRAHVTLGRIKGGSIESLKSCLPGDDIFFGLSKVRNLYCYRSDLSTKGAEYHSMWRSPLKVADRAEAQDEPASETPAEELNGDGTNDDTTGQEQGSSS